MTKAKNPHGEKAEDAAFGAHRAAREPFGAVQGCIRQVSFEDEGRCSARSKRTSRRNQNSRAIPQPARDCRYAAGQTRKSVRWSQRPACPYPAFTGIPQMDGPKRARKHDRCRPEADALRKRVLRVSPKRELFK